VLQQCVGRPPSFGFGLSNDGLKPGSKTHLATMRLGALPYFVEFCFDVGKRLASCQINVDVIGSNLLRSRGRTTDPQFRIKRVRLPVAAC
jgi:hypothetical protein